MGFNCKKDNEVSTEFPENIIDFPFSSNNSPFAFIANDKTDEIVVKHNMCCRSVPKSHSSNIRGLNYKGTSRQRSGKGAIRKIFPLQKSRWEKTILTIRYLYHENIS